MKFIKKTHMRTVGLVSVMAVFALVMSTCVTTGSVNNLSLMDVIEQAAERIASELPTGSRVAVLAFESDSENLSAYIMEELVGALHDRNIEVVDRENLPYLQREMHFQLSGDVSDESALSIGKFLGAKMAITGQMRHLGDTYRFTTNAINIETAVHVSIPRLTVRNDRELQNIVTALNNQTTVVRTARYTVPAEPQTAGAFFDRGISLASQGIYNEAITNFNEAIRINPNMMGAYIMRGRAYVATVASVARVGANFSGIMTYSNDGNITAGQVRVYDLAIADFSKAISLDLNNANAYIERGVAYADKGDYDRAIADFTEAIRLNPNNAMLYSNRGVVYVMIGNYDRAIAEHTEALRLNPNSADVYYNRGSAYSSRNNRGDSNLAIADFTEAVRINPNFADAYYNRGNMYASRDNRGDSDLAIADFTAAIRLDPNNADAYNNRGYMYNSKNDYDRGIADCTYAIRLNPNYVDAYINRGFAYANRNNSGDLDRAIADFTQVIRLEPSNADSYLARGQLYGMKGDFDRAIADFEAVLRINPNDPDARLLIEQVRRMRGR